MSHHRPAMIAGPRARAFVYGIVVFVAIVRIASTYTIFSETSDEPMHLAAGLQVLSEHRYAIQLQNPPLPRVVIAIPPWLAGARVDSAHLSMDVILGEFFSLGHYKRMLVLARVGTLLFFLIAVFCTAWWARREIGEPGALLATILFTTQPSILAHAGLATVDMAGVAGFALGLVAFSYRLDRPSWRNTAIVGIAYGFAIICKLLCIAYVPIACGAIYVARLFTDERARSQWRRSFDLLTVPLVALVVVWIGYGFSVGPVGHLRVPAPAFWQGVHDMMNVNRQGFQSYAFGRASLEGWWWYFPVALVLKTTLGFLLLVIAGFFVRGRAILQSLSAAAAILLFSMTTHVDIGIRYIIAVYVPLSIAAAVATLVLLRHRRRLVRALAIVLLSWHLVASFVAHPDYLAYFNELGGSDPSRYLVDSNLDWGQDVLRLRDVIRRKGISRIGVSLMGPVQLYHLGFPAHHDINPWIPERGWLAVSDHSYRMNGAQGGWQWLNHLAYERVGKSIRLYDRNDSCLVRRDSGEPSVHQPSSDQADVHGRSAVAVPIAFLPDR